MTPPKIGLIARDETMRGLAIQSRNFFDHMPVDRTLVIKMPRPDCLSGYGWYPGASFANYDALHHTLDKDVVCDWMKGLDVVFTAETTYDWQLPNWARDLGVKTVIQGNPEFFRHDQEEWVHQAHPDAWWWPTPWRIDRLPRGQVMPVPMPDRLPSAKRGGKPRFLHVVGKRAWADRNGTDVVIDALRSITEEVDFTIHGTGWELSEIPLPIDTKVSLAVEREGVEDRWTMYADHHVLVLPRRYGGNCLPALEAAACGLGVLMPDVSPNETMASLLISGRYDRTVQLACGPVNVADVEFTSLGRMISELAADPQRVAAAQEHSLRTVPRWSEFRQIYLDELERVCNA